MRAINSNVMKQLNRRLVLDCIRRRPISRAELSDETQLTRASITQIVEALIDEGYVAESVAADSHGPGRKQMKLELLENSLHMAGIHLARTGYHLSIINLAGRVLWSGEGKVFGRNPMEVLEEIAERLRAAMLGLSEPPKRIFGAGFCTPGPIDCSTGTILNPSNFAPWHNLPVVRLLEERLHWKVHMADVSNAHALDEKYFGVGRQGIQDFMLLQVDDGLGAGVVQNGHLFTGPKGQSLEIGHVSVDRSGRECACGNRGCLERYISFPAALEGTPFETWRQVVDGMAVDSAAAAVFNRISDDLSFAIANILHIFSLERIVLSGHFLHGGAQLAAAVNERLARCRIVNAPVVAGNEIQLSRIAAIPAYHYFFAAQGAAPHGFL